MADPWGGIIIKKGDYDARGFNSVLLFKGVLGDTNTAYTFVLSDSDGVAFANIAPIVFPNYSYSTRNRLKFFDNKDDFAVGEDIIVKITRIPNNGSAENYSTTLTVQQR